MKDSPSQPRIVNFDMLRILSMLMIVGIHFFTHGAYKYLDNYASFNLLNLAHGSERIVSSFNLILSEYLFIFYCIGVNCFVLISGYFMVNKKLRISRLFSIWVQTFFYAITIPVLFYLFTYSDKSALTFLFKGVTPIRTNVYWFVTVYLGLMAISPFLSLYVKTIAKRKLQLSLFVLFFVNITFCFNIPLGNVYGGGTSLLFFIFLFLVGAYIRLYDIKWRKCQFGRYFFILSFFVFAFTLAQEFVVGYKHHIFLYHIYILIIVFCSLCRFFFSCGSRIRSFV